MKNSPDIPDIAAGFVRFPLEDHVAVHLRRVIENNLTLKHLPSERKLAACFGVCRSVVRAALKKLEEDRLIARGQGLTTRVIRRGPSDNDFAVIDMMAALAAGSHATCRD